jgi:Tol biopolymer transport system component
MPNTSARVLYLADLTTQTTQTIAVDDFARYLMVWLPTDWIIMLVQDVSSNSLQLTRQRLDQLSDISDSQTDVLYHFRDGGAPSVLLTSPDGHWIAFEDWNKFILLTPETGDTRVLLDLSTIANSSVTNWELLEWSPDGQWIYYYLEENNVTTLYRKPPFAFSNAEAQPLATLPHLSTYDLTWLLLHREAWPRGQIWIMASGSIVLSIGLTAVRAKSPWRWHANASTKG